MLFYVLFDSFGFESTYWESGCNLTTPDFDVDGEDFLQLNTIDIYVGF